MAQPLGVNLFVLTTVLVLTSLPPVALVLAYLGLRRRRDRNAEQRRLAADNQQFEESWASGYSEKSLFTRWSNMNNCLRVEVTDDQLRITPQLPMRWIAAPFDMEHCVRLDAILGIEQRGKVVRVAFELADGQPRTIALRLRDPDRFLAVLQPRVRRASL